MTTSTQTSIGDLSLATVVGGIAYLTVIGVLSYAAIVGSSHDALLALIAIASPTGGAAAVTLLRPRLDPSVQTPVVSGQLVEVTPTETAAA
jgi:hypothetical protein